MLGPLKRQMVARQVSQARGRTVDRAATVAPSSTSTPPQARAGEAAAAAAGALLQQEDRLKELVVELEVLRMQVGGLYTGGRGGNVVQG